MYTNEYYAKIGKGSTLRLIFGLAIWAVIIAASVVGMVIRSIVLAVVAPTLLAPVAYSIWSLKIMPWVRYSRHMDNLKEGRRRETECYIMGIADSTRMVDGVEIHDVTAALDEAGEDTRLYYWDNDMPLPEFDGTKRVKIESFGNFITGIAAAGN